MRTAPTWRSWIWGRVIPPPHPRWNSPSSSSRCTARSTRGCETTSQSSSSSWRRTRWAGGWSSSSDDSNSSALIIHFLAARCFHAGEGVAQPAHPVPQRYSGVLCWEPTAAGRDTEAVPHQVESAGWREFILAWRAIIVAVPRPAPATRSDTTCPNQQKQQESAPLPSLPPPYTHSEFLLKLQMRRKATT